MTQTAAQPQPGANVAEFTVSELSNAIKRALASVQAALTEALDALPANDR